MTEPGTESRYDWAEDATAQDVIDALRIALMAQKEPAEALKVVGLLLEFAPDTDTSRGIDLLLRLISEASLKVALVDA
jgi:hypothetical protein